MTAYYNENDPKAAAWLRELIAAGLIADGVVDERSIADVRAEDLDGYVQCHFFAGIAGWSYALRLAGWPDDVPVWTGSCPCQPFSSAGKRSGASDKRHLWPEFYRLIKDASPPVVFGEQVASTEVVGTQLEAAFVVAVQDGEYGKANKLAKRLAQSRGFHYGPRWIDRVCADLEAADYSFGFKVLGAHSVGAPHIRQRVFWVADSACEGRRGWEQGGTGEREESRRSSPVGGMGDTDSSTKERFRSVGIPLEPEQKARRSDNATAWSEYELIRCADGKTRRIELGVHPLAQRVPGRVGLLRGYGNAINPETTAEFIRAFIECT